ncbi:hypothetical protein V9T40_002358 [Parthenolecanium corni]|uniref:Uncharacterized protein n=1 Tax=Parthenolecanium corni TaxID=536013 RepID=A0AAN9Y5B0_9HEMI
MNNESAIKDLRQETRRAALRELEKVSEDYNAGDIKRRRLYDSEGFEDNSQEIFPLFDYCHLMKCLRNQFMDNDVIFTNSDTLPGMLRALPKLTDEHVIKDKVKKMKLKMATQVFSQRVSATLLFARKLASLYYTFELPITYGEFSSRNQNILIDCSDEILTDRVGTIEEDELAATSQIVELEEDLIDDGIEALEMKKEVLEPLKEELITYKARYNGYRKRINDRIVEVYVILFEAAGGVHPALYALLPNKQTETYVKLFTAVKNLVPHANIKKKVGNQIMNLKYINSVGSVIYKHYYFWQTDNLISSNWPMDQMASQEVGEKNKFVQEFGHLNRYHVKSKTVLIVKRMTIAMSLLNDSEKEHLDTIRRSRNIIIRILNEREELPPIQEEVIGRVAVAQQGENMETEEESAKLVPVVDIGAAIEPQVQIPAANGNNSKNSNSACRLTLSQRFLGYSRKTELKDHSDENVARQRKRLVDSKFARFRINVDSSDDSEDDQKERSTCEKPKVAPSSSKLSNSPVMVARL